MSGFLVIVSDMNMQRSVISHATSAAKPGVTIMASVTCHNTHVTRHVTLTCDAALDTADGTLPGLRDDGDQDLVYTECHCH